MKTEDKQTALVYCRVSSEEQVHGYSLDAQEKSCKRFAETNKLKVLKVYRDEGKSATNLDRPALQDLLSRCKESKGIEAVIVQETDRLARKTQDHLAIKAILKKAGVRLISVAQPMLDESPEGNMIDTILASVNQFQSDLNGRKTKKGLQEKFDSGWWPGLAPLGYLNKSVGEKNIIVKDPTRWELVKEAMAMYLTGSYSAIQISDTLYTKGLTGRSGRNITNGMMISILKNPFYCGIMCRDNQEKTGRHEAMISIDEHQRILSIAQAHGQHASRRRKHDFLLRGFALCAICGQRYTAEKHRNGKNVDYYHCSASITKHSNKGQNVEVEELEKQVEERFQSIQFSKDFIDLVVQKVTKFYREKRAIKETKKRGLLNKKNGIEKKRDTAEEKLIAGTLSDEDFVRMRDRFKQEIDVIQNQIDEIENWHEVDTDTIREVLMLARNIYEAYKKAPNEVKRLYLGFFWDKFLVKNQKIVKAEPTKLVQTLKNQRKIILNLNWGGRGDSNPRSSLPQSDALSR